MEAEQAGRRMNPDFLQKEPPLAMRRAELVWSLIAIALGALYTFISGSFTTLPFAQNLTYGLIITFLTEMVGLLVLSTNSSHRMEDKSDRLLKVGESTNTIVSRLGADTELARGALLRIQASEERLFRESAHLIQQGTILREIGIRTLTGYLSDFEVSESGFSVKLRANTGRCVPTRNSGNSS